jgi:hypothetical protein
MERDGFRCRRCGVGPDRERCSSSIISSQLSMVADEMSPIFRRSASRATSGRGLGHHILTTWGDGSDGCREGPSRLQARRGRRAPEREYALILLGERPAVLREAPAPTAGQNSGCCPSPVSMSGSAHVVIWETDGSGNSEAAGVEDLARLREAAQYEGLVFDPSVLQPLARLRRRAERRRAAASASSITSPRTSARATRAVRLGDGLVRAAHPAIRRTSSGPRSCSAARRAPARRSSGPSSARSSAALRARRRQPLPRRPLQRAPGELPPAAARRGDVGRRSRGRGQAEGPDHRRVPVHRVQGQGAGDGAQLRPAPRHRQQQLARARRPRRAPLRRARRRRRARQNHAYFQRDPGGARPGGREALLHYLLNYDLPTSRSGRSRTPRRSPSSRWRRWRPSSSGGSTSCAAAPANPSKGGYAPETWQPAEKSHETTNLGQDCHLSRRCPTF